MAYIQGTDRQQTGLFCLEDFIDPDAPVRVIDAFCAQVDYITLDFIYIYGYLNGIRSSRKLQQECTRNLELM
jgi:transposase